MYRDRVNGVTPHRTNNFVTPHYQFHRAVALDVDKSPLILASVKLKACIYSDVANIWKSHEIVKLQFKKKVRWVSMMPYIGYRTSFNFFLNTKYLWVGHHSLHQFEFSNGKNYGIETEKKLCPYDCDSHLLGAYSVKMTLI